MREEMRGVTMREEEEEETEVVLKNSKSTPPDFSVSVDYSKPSLYILGQHIPTKCNTDEKGTISIGRQARKRPGLFSDLLSTIGIVAICHTRRKLLHQFFWSLLTKVIPIAAATSRLYSCLNYERQYFAPICYVRNKTSSPTKINHR